MRAAPGLPPALGAAIDRCLARDPAGRFTDGEALAAALAPADARPALPPALRAWLGARNPLGAPYFAWSAVFGTLTTANVIVALSGNRGGNPWDILFIAGATALPIFPIIGFHLNQAYRQFRAGFSLADLRAALEVGRRERAETEALVGAEKEPASHRPLRLATTAAATWLGVTFLLGLTGVLRENEVVGGMLWFFVPMFETMVLGAVSNALEVRFIPDQLRQGWRTGIRDRLWNSRVGAWLARRLGAPEQSRAVGGGVFRATEAALGVAASELFAALPKAHQEQLGELPAIVAALEARAAEARSEMEVLDAMAPSASDAAVLAARRTVAKRQLAESVATLESIRLDLLRLHAGAGDLAPLTTLMDDARRIGEDLSRLAEAQREVEEAAGDRSGASRIATPT